MAARKGGRRFASEGRYGELRSDERSTAQLLRECGCFVPGPTGEEARKCIDLERPRLIRSALFQSSLPDCSGRVGQPITVDVR